MQVICLGEDAFFELVDRLVERVDQKLGDRQQKWIDGSEVMKILNIKALSTLQSMRDEGKIRFSQPSKKIILYDRNSINEYLEKHAKNTF